MKQEQRKQLAKQIQEYRKVHKLDLSIFFSSDITEINKKILSNRFDKAIRDKKREKWPDMEGSDCDGYAWASYKERRNWFYPKDIDALAYAALHDKSLLRTLKKMMKDV